jgi:hypothetical protein
MASLCFGRLGHVVTRGIRANPRVTCFLSRIPQGSSRKNEVWTFFRLIIRAWQKFTEQPYSVGAKALFAVGLARRADAGQN